MRCSQQLSCLPCALFAPRSSLLAPRSSLLPAPCSLLPAPCSLLPAPCLPLTTYNLLLTAHCSLLPAYCSLLTAHVSKKLPYHTNSGDWSPAFSLLSGHGLGPASRSFRAGGFDLGVNVAPVDSAARERTRVVTFVQVSSTRAVRTARSKYAARLAAYYLVLTTLYLPPATCPLTTTPRDPLPTTHYPPRAALLARK